MARRYSSRAGRFASVRASNKAKIQASNARKRSSQRYVDSSGKEIGFRMPGETNAQARERIAQEKYQTEYNQAKSERLAQEAQALSQPNTIQAQVEQQRIAPNQIAGVKEQAKVGASISTGKLTPYRGSALERDTGLKQVDKIKLSPQQSPVKSNERIRVDNFQSSSDKVIGDKIVVYRDGVPALVDAPTGVSVASAPGVKESVNRPFNPKKSQSFGEKVKLVVQDYTDFRKGEGFYSKVLSSGLATEQGEIFFVSGVQKLFSPFSRFRGERRKGEEEVLQVPNQGTTTDFNLQTNTFQDPKVTRFDMLDRKVAENPDIILPPQLAYEKDVEEQVRIREEEIKPGYQARVTALGAKYQSQIDAGEIDYDVAKTQYETEVAGIQANYSKEVLAGVNTDPIASVRYQQSVDFQKEYGELSKDVAIQPSTIATGGLLVGASLVGGLPAIAVSTGIGLGGASTIVRGVSKASGGDVKGGLTDIGVGTAMFVGGTYGAMKLSANMVTQQQIVDVQKATKLQPTARFSLSRNRFQDTYKLYGKTSTATLRGGGDTTWKYYPSTKTYSIKASSQTQAITTTDYWTGKPLNVNIYSTTDYGTSQIVPTNSLLFKGGGVKISSVSRPGEITTDTLTFAKSSTKYSYSFADDVSQGVFKTSSQSRDFVVGGRTFYNPSTGSLRSLSGEGRASLFVDFSDDAVTSGVGGTFSKDTYGTIVLSKPAGQQVYNLQYPPSAFGGKGGVPSTPPGTYNFDFPGSGGSGFSTDFGSGSGYVQSSQRIKLEPLFSPSQATANTNVVVGKEIMVGKQIIVGNQVVTRAVPIVVPTTIPQPVTLNSQAVIGGLTLGAMKIGALEKTMTLNQKVTYGIGNLQKIGLIQLGAIQTFVPATGTGTKQSVKPVSITKPAITQPTITPNPGTPTGLIPGIGGGFGFPGFPSLGGASFGSFRKGRVKGNVKYGYTPSFKALAFGITGKKPSKGSLPSGRYTGFEFRPVTKNWLGNIFKKKRKKKR